MRLPRSVKMLTFVGQAPRAAFLLVITLKVFCCRYKINGRVKFHISIALPRAMAQWGFLQQRIAILLLYSSKGPIPGEAGDLRSSRTSFQMRLAREQLRKDQ